MITLTRLTDPLLHSAVRQVNQDSAGEQGRRQLTDCLTLIKPVLQDLVRLELNGVGLMDSPPQELVALDASDEPGLREAMRGHIASGCAWSRSGLAPWRNCSEPGHQLRLYLFRTPRLCRHDRVALEHAHHLAEQFQRPDPSRCGVVGVGSFFPQTADDPVAGESVIVEACLKEVLRLRLRGLVPFLDKKKRKIVYTDFQDEVMGVREEPALYMPKMTGAQYEKKVKEYLRNHLDHLVVRRLRTNQPLTDTDLKGLESILVEKHATSSVADKRDVQPLDAVAPPRAGGADRNRRGLPRRVMPSLPIPTKSSTHSERIGTGPHADTRWRIAHAEQRGAGTPAF